MIAVLGACSKSPVIDQRVVTLYTLGDPANAITPGSCAVPTSAYAQYSASGDFEPDPSSPPISGVYLNVMSPALSEIPDSTRQLSLNVAENQWRGYGIIPATGDIAVSLWAAGHECELKTSVDTHPGGTITPYDDHHVLVAGGFGQPSFIANISNGSITQLGLAQEITTPRALATATKFSGGVLIAGGDFGNSPMSDAEIFSSQSGSFTGDSINLGVPRALHGATLLTNGSILLVGGETNATTLYQSLEVIDPIAKRATQASLAELVTARANPTVLTLTSGEVLVAGGVDASGNAVGSVEWFSSTASVNETQATIASSHHEAFVALPAGGALGVVSPDSAGVTTTWLITSDYKIQQGAPLAAVPPGSNIRLFTGTGGAPLLWTGANWFRWSPWTGAFVPFSEATSIDGSTLANGPSVDAVTTSPDSGLALWLENDGVEAGKVVGLRFDSRGDWSTDIGSLIDSDTPKSLAPDRLPSATKDSSGSTLTIDTVAGITLTNTAAVVLTDATFADFSLDLDMSAAPSIDPSGIAYPPIIFLRDDLGSNFSIGFDPRDNTTCQALVDPHWHITRSGGSITVLGSSGKSVTCGGLSATSRVSIGLRGRASSTPVPCIARNIVVERAP